MLGEWRRHGIVWLSLSMTCELAELGGAQLLLVDLARLALGLKKVLHSAVVRVLRVAAAVPSCLVHVG